MNAPTTLTLGGVDHERSLVAAAKPAAVAPLLVSSLEAVARSQLITVPVDTRLVEAAERLSGARIGVAVVCDAAGAAIGTITETMLLRHLGLGQADFFATRVGDVMTQEFTTCTPQELLSDVLAMMQSRGLIHVLLIRADKHLLGVLNAHDGLRALLAANPPGCNHQQFTAL